MQRREFFGFNTCSNHVLLLLLGMKVLLFTIGLFTWAIRSNRGHLCYLEGIPLCSIPDLGMVATTSIKLAGWKQWKVLKCLNYHSQRATKSTNIAASCASYVMRFRPIWSTLMWSLRHAQSLSKQLDFVDSVSSRVECQ